MLDRLRRAAMAVAALFVSLFMITAPAHAEGESAVACTSGGGVWVVVEGGKSGCAKNPATGTEALKQIGVKVSENKGMLCALDDAPADACTKSFAENGEQYWMYFHAQPGSDWQFSQESANQYKPKPGSVEGWVWGKTETTKPTMPSFGAAATSATAATSHTGSASPAPTIAQDPAHNLWLPLGLTAVLVAAGVALYVVSGRKAKAAAKTEQEH